MNIQKLIAQKEVQRDQDNYISFSDKELLNLNDDEIQHIIEYFHGYTMMRLPAHEVVFFDWLKKNDAPVWNDLWGTEEDLYLVSVDLLRHLAGENALFPICDLIDEPNYWFCEKHIKPEGTLALNDVLHKIEDAQNLNLAEEFLLQLSGHSQDIWHFAYQFNVTVDKMKKTVENMVFQGWIVHLPDRADLVKYIEF